MGKKDVSLYSNGTITVTVTVSYNTGTRSFLGYYGSQPCYEDNYDETEYDVEIEYDTFTDWLVDQSDFLSYLEENNPELYHKFIDDDDDWDDSNATEEDKKTLVDDCAAYCSDKFYEWAQKIGQEQYNNRDF